MTNKFNTRSSCGLLKKSLLALALGSSAMLTSAHAQITTVYYILLENRNWSENETSGGAQILGSTAAPYLNSLVTPGNANAAQVSYCQCYHNVLALPGGATSSIHPSEPNYVWMESGSNFSISNDNDPYGSGLSVQTIFNYAAAHPTLIPQNFSGLLQNAGLTWKSYSEGTQLLNANGSNYNTAGGTLTNNVAPSTLWTVPLVSFSGTSTSYTNPYNHSHQYNFATKHTGELFFPNTNGSTINTADTQVSPYNVEALHYPPLEQLASDLSSLSTTAAYNVITPDQYNDMHTALTGGFTYHGTAYTGDLAQIAQGDNFCSIIVPEIMAGAAYQAGHAAIVIWTDETEGSNQNDFSHTLAEIVISPLAKGNAYASTLNYTHSSDIATLQEIFGVTANTPTGYLNDAANYSNPTGTFTLPTGTSQNGYSKAIGFGTGIARDMADLLNSGVIPSQLPGLNLAASGYAFNRKTGAYSQNVTVMNTLTTAITTPVYLVVGNLSSNAALTNSAGTTVNNFTGSPYVAVSPTGLAAGASKTVTLQFTNTGGAISDTMNVIQTASQP